MNKSYIFLNSSPCNLIIEKEFKAFPKNAGYLKSEFFDRFARLYYIPLINEKLPEGCELFYESYVKSAGGFCACVRENEKLTQTIQDANESDGFDIFADLEEYYRANKNAFGFHPSLINYDSVLLAAFLFIVGYGLEDCDTWYIIRKELNARYNDGGGFASLRLSDYNQKPIIDKIYY